MVRRRLSQAATSSQVLLLPKVDEEDAFTPHDSGVRHGPPSILEVGISQRQSTSILCVPCYVCDKLAFTLGILSGAIYILTRCWDKNSHDGRCAGSQPETDNGGGERKGRSLAKTLTLTLT